MPDRVILEGLELECRIGVTAGERQRPRPLVLDVELTTDLVAAGRSDRVDDAVDYAAVAATVREAVGPGPIHLLETVAERASAAVLERFPAVSAVRLRVTKPGAVPGVAASGVAVERGR